MLEVDRENCQTEVGVPSVLHQAAGK